MVKIKFEVLNEQRDKFKAAARAKGITMTALFKRIVDNMRPEK